jgi:hypothetical protein
MPGLLRGVARTAVVAGTATAVSNRVSRRQANRWAEQGSLPATYYAEPAPQQAAPQPVYQQPVYQEPVAQQPVAAAPDVVEQLTKLAQLKEAGVLTDEEFAAQKARILNA